MKEKIISILIQADGKVVSGVELSKNLNVSRVAVWKHLQQLKESGCDIESTPKGYILKNQGDILFSNLFPKREDLIFFFPSISSTMDKARDIARKDGLHFSVIIAGEQTRGRGRLNRAWLSSRGGLWFTIILKPDLPPPLAYRLNFAASICLAATLKEHLGIDATVKWPNDILVNGKKLAGLLSEMETRGDMISFVNIGIGLNVNNDPEKDEPNAVSIRKVLGKSVPRRPILSAFLDSFEAMILNIDQENVIHKWKASTSTIGKQVTLKTHKESFHGLAKDVDDTGALIIVQPDGIEKRIIYGDCFHNM